MKSSKLKFAIIPVLFAVLVFIEYGSTQRARDADLAPLPSLPLKPLNSNA